MASGSIMFYLQQGKCIWFRFGCCMVRVPGVPYGTIQELTIFDDPLRMLHTLSQAAAEHSRTYGDLTAVSSGLSIRNITSGYGGYGHSGQSLSFLEDVDSLDSGDEAVRLSCCQRLGICIGYVIPDWGHLSLFNVGRSWAAGAIALWHCYLFAACASLIIVNSAAAMLRCYIQWFSETRIHAVTFYTMEFKYHVTLGFFGAFFRCYILLSVTSDLLRFTYLLCKDTWRPDSFEGYRRLLVADAWKEIEAGEFYSNNWSMCLTWRQKIMDAGSWFQYLSIYPPVIQHGNRKHINGVFDWEIICRCRVSHCHFDYQREIVSVECSCSLHNWDDDAPQEQWG